VPRAQMMGWSRVFSLRSLFGRPRPPLQLALHSAALQIAARARAAGLHIQRIAQRASCVSVWVRFVVSAITAILCSSQCRSQAKRRGIMAATGHYTLHNFTRPPAAD
jgi:hypothetical protein